MEITYETSLLAKLSWSAALVLGLTAIAERVSTRIAGILSGAPQNAMLIYFFVGYDMGTSYVVESIPHGVASFTATLAFVLVYYGASSWLDRYAVVGGSLAGIAAFVVVAFALSTIRFTSAGAVALTSIAIILTLWSFRKIELVAIAIPVRYTAKLLMLRGGFAVVLIVIVITLAETLGARWAGLLAGFPAVLWPTLLIIHITYGAASTHALIRNFPLGVISILLYILSISFTFPLWGVYGGTVASLGISLVYLIAVMLLGR